MKLDDLDLRDLLAFEPKGGVVRFAGDRALILDAVALGVLRKTLIDTLGERGARGVLTRFGFTHGQRTAIAMRTAFPWDDERDWRRAGGRLHQLQGLVVPETWPDSPHFVEALWHDSYEAEQHLIHVGRCDHPVCWAQCGFTTGYLSYVNQREIYALEVRCRGRGDAVCHMIAKPREAWATRWPSTCRTTPGRAPASTRRWPAPPRRSRPPSSGCADSSGRWPPPRHHPTTRPRAARRCSARWRSPRGWRRSTRRC